MIRLGIIGVGGAGQLLHLPALKELRDTYELTACCDISKQLVDFIVDNYNFKKGYYTAEELIADPEIDAVIISSVNKYHVPYAKECLKVGKDVLVEKPISLSKAELEDLVEFHKQYPNNIVMVGYCRRFLGNFLRMKEMVQNDPRPITYAKFSSNITEGWYYVGQTRKVFRGNDLPPRKPEDWIKSKELFREATEKEYGRKFTDAELEAYVILAQSGVHVMSAAREILGYPKSVKSFNISDDGKKMITVFEYDGFMALYEQVGDQQVEQFDEKIEIFQGNRRMLCKYESPYIKYLPTYLEVTETDKATLTSCTRREGPYFDDLFTNQLKYFAECITERKTPKCDDVDALEDYQMFLDMLNKQC